MRILIIRNYPSTFQLSDRSYNIQELGLARALRKRGHACDVVFYTAGQDSRQQVACENGPITVYLIHGVNILKNGVFSRRMDALARDYDIVQISEYNQIQSFLYAGRFPEKTVVLHGPYYAPFNKRYNQLCKLADVCFLGRYKRLKTHFMVKSALAEEFLLGKGIAPECVEQVYVGLDEAAFHAEPSSEPPEFVRRVCAGGHPMLLYIGRIEPRRKYLFLLDVFREIRKRAPQARLTVIGDGAEGDKAAFQARMEALGIADCVDWTPRLQQQELPPLYHRASAFLMPTEYDIFGMVLLEAMYFGAAVLCSRCGGSDTLIQNGRNGIVFQQDTVESWAREALRMMEDDALRSRMGEAAAETIRSGFTWDAISEGYLRCYQKKLTRKEVR